MLYKINEIFYSIIGEGKYTGTPATFIRLAGCNKKCKWCDTPHENYVQYDEDYLSKKSEANPSSVVVITGGEPLRQNIKPLLKKLHESNLEAHIETNGTFRIDPDTFQLTGWISVSPKGTSWREDTMRIADEVKILCRTKGWKQQIADIKPFLKHDCIKWIMPIDESRNEPSTFRKDLSKRNLLAAIQYVKLHPDWRLCAQVHKYINVK